MLNTACVHPSVGAGSWTWLEVGSGANQMAASGEFLG